MKLKISSLLLFCLCLSSRAAEPVKGATKLMLDAKASFMASAPPPPPPDFVVPPDTNKYPLYVSWDKSDDVHTIGYNVYHGTNSGVYPNLSSAGNINSNVINVVTNSVTNFIVATAYNDLGLESPYSEEVQYPPPQVLLTPITNYVTVTLDYFSSSLQQWVTNYASRTYTNPPLGSQFFRYRNGDKTNSPNANNRAWQVANSMEGPFLDIPDTVVQNTNSGPIRFSIKNWFTGGEVE